MSRENNIIDRYPLTKEFLTEEEQLNICDDHMQYAILEKLLTRIAAS